MRGMALIDFYFRGRPEIERGRAGNICICFAPFLSAISTPSASESVNVASPLSLYRVGHILIYDFQG